MKFTAFNLFAIIATVSFANSAHAGKITFKYSTSDGSEKTFYPSGSSPQEALPNINSLFSEVGCRGLVLKNNPETFSSNQDVELRSDNCKSVIDDAKCPPGTSKHEIIYASEKKEGEDQKDLAVNVCVASAAEWKNSRTLSNGTIWSDVLPLNYANCISEKDQAGHPILEKDNSFNSDVYFVNCKRNRNGKIAGNSADYTVIEKSDAVSACKAIGGDLPLVKDYKEIGNEIKKLPHQEKHWFWTASWTSGKEIGLNFADGEMALVFNGNFGTDGNSGWIWSGAFIPQHRHVTDVSVRCISHPQEK